MEVTFQPLGDRVVIKPLEEEEVTKGRTGSPGHRKRETPKG